MRLFPERLRAFYRLQGEMAADFHLVDMRDEPCAARVCIH